jgi:hypothetical protein
MVAALAWGALKSAAHREWLRGHEWWRIALRPQARWTLLILLALWAAALALYWWPRRRGTSNVPLIALLTMVTAGSVLGGAAFFPCASGQAPVVAPVSWVLLLYAGSMEPRFGPQTSCPGQIPLAMELARVVCMGATFVGVAAAAAMLWRREIDRHKTRFLSELTVVTGLDPMSVALVDKFVAESSGRRVVLVEPDPNHPLLEEARATGARVIIADPKRPEAMRPVLLHLSKPAVRRVFALYPGAQDNEQILAAVRDVLSQATRRADHHPHLVARIDDPRHADTWRGKHISPHRACLEDAISPCETTAEFAVRAAVSRRAEKLILCGDTTLALAILIEVARLAWEGNDLIAAAQPNVPGLGPALTGSARGRGAIPPILVLADRAGDLRREFTATVSPQLRAAMPDVEIEPVPWRTSLLALLDRMPPHEAAACVVVITEDPTPEGIHEAGRVARLHPSSVIYTQSVDGTSGAEIAFDNLHQFRVGFLVDGVLPVDTWTRLARHNHERYRLHWPVQNGREPEPGRRPWADLDEFYREDNIRQIRQILGSAVTQGRVWRPVRTVPPGSRVEFIESELEAMARAEHERWYARRVAANWHPADAGKDHPSIPGRGSGPRKVNASVVPWESLPPAMRRKNAAHITSILGQLEAIGYVAVLPDAGPPQAEVFVRRGEVHAARLDAPRLWETAQGTALLGGAGDWTIRDQHGCERTARDREFRASHRHLGGDRWERTGTVRAWQVEERTVIRTLEGPAVAGPGDWIAQGENGERWPVPADQFRQSYTRDRWPVPPA